MKNSNVSEYACPGDVVLALKSLCTSIVLLLTYFVRLRNTVFATLITVQVNVKIIFSLDTMIQDSEQIFMLLRHSNSLA